MLKSASIVYKKLKQNLHIRELLLSTHSVDLLLCVPFPLVELFSVDGGVVCALACCEVSPVSELFACSCSLLVAPSSLPDPT